MKPSGGSDWVGSVTTSAVQFLPARVRVVVVRQHALRAPVVGDRAVHHRSRDRSHHHRHRVVARHRSVVHRPHRDRHRRRAGRIPGADGVGEPVGVVLAAVVRVGEGAVRVQHQVAVRGIVARQRDRHRQAAGRSGRNRVVRQHARRAVRQHAHGPSLIDLDAVVARHQRGRGTGTTAAARVAHHDLGRQHLDARRGAGHPDGLVAFRLGRRSWSRG